MADHVPNHEGSADVDAPLLDEATGLVSRVVTAARRHQIQLLQDADELAGGTARVGPRHLAALAVIVAHGALSVTALADTLEVTVATASLMAKDLEANDLVHREPDPADRRRTILKPSTSKPGEVESMLMDRADPIRRTLSQLEPDQREAFLRGLAVLEQELGQRR